jgi:retinol-binding protein 3
MKTRKFQDTYLIPLPPHFVVMALLFFSMGKAYAVGDPAKAFDQRQVVNTISDLLNANYVSPELGRQAAEYIESRLTAGEYSKISSASAFAGALTADLRSVSHDRHLTVVPDTTANPPSSVEVVAQNESAAWRAARANYGFEKLEHLPGNVGYLDLRGFSPSEIGGPTAIAAMNFLTNSSAVIIDLRQNGGGEPSMIQLITSYFFVASVHLNDIYWRKGNRTEQFWTLPYVPGKKMPETPLYVLISSGTFSAAEEFAYNLKALKRATIIGETTGGGANPGDSFPVGSGFAIFIPTGRAINPVTGSNWEGVGVIPDRAVSSKEALDEAYREALIQIESQSKDAEQRAEAAWASVTLEARLHPIGLSPEAKKALVGGYGHSQVILEEDELYLVMQGGQRFRLIPLTHDTFALDGAEEPRLRFVADRNGSVQKFVQLYTNGESDEVIRH